MNLGLPAWANPCVPNIIVQDFRAVKRAYAAFYIPLLIAALWLATRPYVGVIQDSRFYTVQAVSALLPGRFAEDLYFRYGSQDQFTLFTVAYEPVMAALGIAKAALVLTVVGQCLWVSGLIYLSYGLFRDRLTALIAISLAIVLPAGMLLNYGEQFLTPRIFSEAITLWALGSMLRGRSLRALSFLSISAAIHPLMTLPGFAILFVYQAARRRAWWALGALTVIACLGLASNGVQPFVRIFDSFDPAWFAVVRVRDDFCLLTQWGTVEWLKTCNIFLLAALRLTVAEPLERRFLVSAFVVATGGLVTTFVGGDLLRNVLVVDAQQYRATWLLAVAANIFVAPLLLRIRWNVTSSLTRVSVVIAGGMLIVSTFFVVGLCLATPVLFFAGLAASLEQYRQKPISAAANMFGLIIVGLLCGATLMVLYFSMVLINGWPRLLWYTTRGLGLVVITLGAVAVYVSSSADTRKKIGPPMTVFAAGLTAIAALSWDQRTRWTEFVETAGTAPESLTSLLSPEGQVYWEGDVRVPWFVLKVPSYFSCEQGTGSLFFRGTAISYNHRYENFRPLQPLDFGQAKYCPVARSAENAAFGLDEIASLCKQEPGLGTLVLTHAVPNAPGRVWVSPVKFEDFRSVDGTLRLFTTDRFFIYSCSAFR